MAKYGLVKNPQADKENINANNPLYVQKSKISKNESKNSIEFEKEEYV